MFGFNHTKKLYILLETGVSVLAVSLLLADYYVECKKTLVVTNQINIKISHKTVIYFVYVTSCGFCLSNTFQNPLLLLFIKTRDQKNNENII